MESVVNKGLSPCSAPGAAPLGAQAEPPLAPLAVIRAGREPSVWFYARKGASPGIMLHYHNYVTSSGRPVSLPAKPLEGPREGGGGSRFSTAGTPTTAKTGGVGSIRGTPAHSRPNFFEDRPVLAVVGAWAAAVATIWVLVVLVGLVWAVRAVRRLGAHDGSIKEGARA